VRLWAETAPGVDGVGRRDPEDPEVVEVVWAVRDGVEIVDARAVGGGLLVVRFRLGEDA